MNISLVKYAVYIQWQLFDRGKMTVGVSSAILLITQEKPWPMKHHYNRVNLFYDIINLQNANFHCYCVTKIGVLNYHYENYQVDETSYWFSFSSKPPFVFSFRARDTGKFAFPVCALLPFQADETLQSLFAKSTI